MGGKNWRGISIPPKCTDGRNDGSDIYRRIFTELDIKEVIEFDIEEYDLKKAAELIKKIVNSDSKKPLIISLEHYLIAHVIDDSTDLVYFDAHSDDYDTEIFHDGSFINFMKGKLCPESDKFQL